MPINSQQFKMKQHLLCVKRRYLESLQGGFILVLHLYPGTKPRSGKLCRASIDTPVHWGVAVCKVEEERGGGSYSSVVSVLLEPSPHPLKSRFLSDWWRRLIPQKMHRGLPAAALS